MTKPSAPRARTSAPRARTAAQRARAPTLMRALDVDGPSLAEGPIDYRENLRLTEHLGALSGSG